MYRELEEEVGLKPEHVRILGRTRHWLRYEVPEKWIRRDWRGTYRGQKQIWYLLRMVGRDCDVKLRGNGKPEFDAWRWHDYWVPVEAVIEFKREVYRQALTELHRFQNADRRRRPNPLRSRPPSARGAVPQHPSPHQPKGDSWTASINRFRSGNWARTRAFAARCSPRRPCA